MCKVAIISDQDGNNLEQVIVSYNNHLNREYNTEVYSYVRSLDNLKLVLREIFNKNVLIVYSLASVELSDFIRRFCKKYSIKSVNIYKDYSIHVSKYYDFMDYDYTLDNNYFSKVECIEFAIKNDDGKSYKALEEADIIILGISRTGKTPLSMYLAFRGYKVANIPLFTGMELPENLIEVDSDKIFGLVNSVENLCDIRLKRIGDSKSFYTQKDSIIKELNFAYAIYDQYNCDIINTDNIAIEEIAHYIENKVKERR